MKTVKKILIIGILICIALLGGYIAISNGTNNIKIKKGNSGTYESKVTLKIKKKSGYTYYYTEDGSKPDKHDDKLGSSLKIDESTVVKVIGYDGNKKTNVLTLDYIIEKDIKNDIKKKKEKDGNAILKITDDNITLGNYNYASTNSTSKRTVDFADNVVFCKVSKTSKDTEIKQISIDDIDKLVEENGSVYAYIIYNNKNLVQEVILYEEIKNEEE